MFSPRPARWAALALLCAAAACAPRYNWHFVNDPQGQFAASFPAHESTESRPVQLAGQTLTMRMSVASVGKTTFAIGVIVLPRDDAALRARVQTQLSADLGAKLGQGGTPTAVRVQTDSGPIAGIELDASGTVPHQEAKREARVRVIGFGARVYQLAVISEQALPLDESKQFFDSFRPF